MGVEGGGWEGGDDRGGLELMIFFYKESKSKNKLGGGRGYGGGRGVDGRTDVQAKTNLPLKLLRS